MNLQERKREIKRQIQDAMKEKYFPITTRNEINKRLDGKRAFSEHELLWLQAQIAPLVEKAIQRQNREAAKKLKEKEESKWLRN